MKGRRDEGMRRDGEMERWRGEMEMESWRDGG
jgi:hypothetical protein